MRKGFTLIELLIVVAIIAILAAIAVPNFLEAQTRSKVSRSMADIRSIATALESYAVDNNKYPIDGLNVLDGQAYWYVPGGPTGGSGGTWAGGITSPIAYISSNRLIDPFRTMADGGAAKALDVPDSTHFEAIDYCRFRYRNSRYTWIDGRSAPGYPQYYQEYVNAFGDWAINGAGPDRSYGPSVVPTGYTVSISVPYDPTNGTTSRGDIVRSQKESKMTQK